MTGETQWCGSAANALGQQAHRCDHPLQLLGPQILPTSVVNALRQMNQIDDIHHRVHRSSDPGAGNNSLQARCVQYMTSMRVQYLSNASMTQYRATAAMTLSKQHHTARQKPQMHVASNCLDAQTPQAYDLE